MAMLTSIEINGYRSIRNASLELRSLNVLIGANGAGKSNFVSFFKMLNEMMAGRLQQYFGMTGRAQSVLYLGPKVTPRLDASLEFEEGGVRSRYHMQLICGANDTLSFSSEILYPDIVAIELTRSLGVGHEETQIRDEVARRNEAAMALQYFLNECRAYHFHDTSPTARVRLHCYINDNRKLLPDAGNLAALLYYYRERSPMVYRRIISTIQMVMPEFHDFELEPDRLNPNDINLNWRKRGSEYLFGPHQISDGSLRAMAIITLFLQPENDLPNVIILDEPELGLHPYALGIVAGLIRSASVKSQVIVATQSASFVEYFEPSEVVVVDSLAGHSSFRRLETDDYLEWLNDYTLGELWKRNIIGGGPIP